MSTGTGHRRAGTPTGLRVLGQGLWILIPVASIGFLAWVPAVQVYWRARTTGWLLTAAALLLATAAVITGMAIDASGAGWGGLVIANIGGGVVAAAAGRGVVFGRLGSPDVDPALHQALADRDRRRQAREIVERDPALALDLGIGRCDGTYDDGGLVDLNNAKAEHIAAALGWDTAIVAAFTKHRDARHGYASLDELLALSALNPQWLEHDAERIVVLPHRPGRQV